MQSKWLGFIYLKPNPLHLNWHQRFNYLLQTKAFAMKIYLLGYAIENEKRPIGEHHFSVYQK